MSSRRLFALFCAGVIFSQSAFAASAMRSYASTLNISEFVPAVERLMKEEKTADALKLAEIGLEKNPKNTQLAFMRAVALEKMGNINEATSILESMISTYPEIPEPYNNLAVIYANQGQLEKALGLLKKAVLIRPTFALAKKNLGDVYFSLALEQYRQVESNFKSNKTLQERLHLMRNLELKR